MKKTISTFLFFTALSVASWAHSEPIDTAKAQFSYRPIPLEKIPWVTDIRVLSTVTINNTQDYLSVFDSSALAWKKIKITDFLTETANGEAWLLSGQAITAENSLGSTDAFGVNFITNNVNRLRLSSAGRFFTGTLTDVNLVASDSVKLTGATMDLAPTAELKVTSAAQTSLRSIGGLHSYISATSPNASGNAGHLWENSADANDGYSMRREDDGKFIFARATDYPYSTETDTIFRYNQSINTFDFDVTNLTLNGAPLSGADNLGNHSATQDLDLNSFNITELDSLKSTDTIIVSATKIIANGTSGLDVIRSAGGRVAGLYGSSTIGYLGLLKTSGGTLMTSLGYGDGILTGNLTDATSLRSENALHFAANGDNLILSINSGRVYSNAAELTDFLIAPTDSFNLKVGANGLIASTAFTRLVANGLISFQANHSTGATAMVIPDSTATATSISISGGANAFHVNSANGAEITTLGTGTTGSTVRLEADTLKVNDIAVSTIWADGVWTPTLTGVLNVAASTAYECQYLRVGNTVTFSGKLDLDPTSTGTTGLGISLPVASDFTAAEKAGGTAKSTSATERTAVIYADATNNRLTLYLEAADTANQSFWFTGSYRIQ